MHMRRWWLVLIILLLVPLLAACNLGQDDTDEDDIPTLEPIDPDTRPTVTILSPENDAEVVINETVLISASASDGVGITQVQLYANGDLVRTVSSESPTGDRQKNVLLDYIPRTVGEVVIEVIARRGTVSSDPAQTTLNVRSTQSQVTATPQTNPDVPVIDPNDPTCRALTNVSLNFRSGPSTSFAIIGGFSTGTLLPVIGRLGDNSWYQVQNGATRGWVSGNPQFVTLYGSFCVNVPVVAAPATPTPSNLTATPTPQPTATATQIILPTSTPGLPNLDAPSIGGPTSLTIPAGETEVSATYGVSIRNRGSAVNAQFANTIRVNPGGSTLDLGTVGNLGSGESISLSRQLTFTGTGTFTVIVTVDNNNNITEDSETDNIAQIQVEVVQAP